MSRRLIGSLFTCSVVGFACTGGCSTGSSGAGGSEAAPPSSEDVQDPFPVSGGDDVDSSDDDSDADSGDDDGGDDGPTPTGETLDLGGGVSLELVRIQAGTFLMGSDSPEAQGNEQPVHSVTISRDFYIGRYEVTQAQYEAVMGDNPSFFDDCGGDCPVEQETWEDAVDFIDALIAMTGYELRLPTEAEWEYACRAGTTTEYSFGDDDDLLDDYAWYHLSADETHAVGQKLPNPWGLYDVHGNVWEWCNDWYDDDYYEVSPSVDPAGPASGTFRVLRGGSWFEFAFVLRSPIRRPSLPVARSQLSGFRVAVGT